MLNKKFVLLTIFIVSLLAVTAVTAIENNENSMTGLSESDILDSENNMDKINSRDHDDDDDDFSAVGNKKKESDLEIDSKIVKSGKKVKITSYIFDDETDKIAKTAKGIEDRKSVV